MYFRDRHDPVEEALLYVAGPGNPNFVGEQPLAEIAGVIARSHGPSGANREYVTALHAALVEMGGRDDHVAALAALVDAHEAE